MIIKANKARLLTAESNRYLIKGDDIISHKVRLSIEGEIYPVRSSEEEVRKLQNLVGKEVDVELSLDSRKEAISLRIVTVSESKK